MRKITTGKPPRKSKVKKAKKPVKITAETNETENKETLEDIFLNEMN